MPRPRTNCLRVSGQGAGLRESPVSSAGPPEQAASRTLRTETQQGQPAREEFWAFMDRPEIATSGVDRSRRGRHRPSACDRIIHHIVFFIRARCKVNRIVPAGPRGSNPPAGCPRIGKAGSGQRQRQASRKTRPLWERTATAHGVVPKPEVPRKTRGKADLPRAGPSPQVRPTVLGAGSSHRASAAGNPMVRMPGKRDPCDRLHPSCPPLQGGCARLPSSGSMQG